jgi:hypothetical protein
MKMFALLFTMAVAFAASGALAQGQGDVCSNQYGSCMDRCTSRPKSVQDSCSQMCEANTSRCYEGIYGSSAQSSQPVEAAEAPDSEARDARDEAKVSEKPKAKRK